MQKSTCQKLLTLTAIGIIIFFIMYTLFLLQIVLVSTNSTKIYGWFSFLLEKQFFIYSISFVPMIIAVGLLLFICHYIGHMWTKGPASLNELKRAELYQRIIRATVYFDTVATVGCSSISTLRESPWFIWHIVSLVVAFAISNGQSLFRCSYRRWPVISITIGNTLLLSAVLLTMHEWSFLSNLTFNITKLVSIANGNPIVMIMSFIVGLIFLSPLGEAKKQQAVNCINDAHKDRRRLLAHWNYKENSALRTHENAVTVVIGVHAIIYALIFSIISVIESNKEIQSNDSSPSFYLFFLAALCCSIGFYSHWQISDERLLQSEFYYLAIHSCHLTAEDIFGKSPRWQDFCQVVVNNLSASTGISSENTGFHDLHHMLSKIQNHFSIHNGEIAFLFRRDILIAMNNKLAVLDKERKENRKNNTKRPWFDWEAVFANEYRELLTLDNERNITTYNILNSNDPFTVILHAEKCFFNKNGFWAGYRRTNSDACNADYLLLAKLEVLKYYFGSDKIESGNILHYIPEKKPLTLTEKKHRLEALFLYPYLIRDGYKNRCGKQFMSQMQFFENVNRYYKQLMDHSMGELSKSTIEKSLYEIKKYFGNKFRKEYKTTKRLILKYYFNPVKRKKINNWKK